MYGVALAWAWLLAGHASRVLAEPRVVYSAPAACPEQAVFVERLRARLQVRVPANTSLQVTLVTAGGGTHGSVEIERGANRTRRSIDGGRCDEVVEALALITALALSERDVPKRPVRKADKPRAAEASPQPSTPAEPAPSQPRAAEPVPQPSTPAEPAPSQPRAAEPAPQPSTPAERATPAPLQVEAAPAPSQEDPPTSWHAGGRIAAAAALFSGLAPALQPGLQLQAAWDLRSDALTWSLQLGGRIALPDSVSTPGGDARFGFVSGLLRLCGSGPLGSARLALTGCAVAEPGVHTSTGENALNARSHSRLWLALGAGADLGVRVTSWLSLRTGAELLAPVRRDRALLAGEALYRIPPLGLRLHLGIEVPFG